MPMARCRFAAAVKDIRARLLVLEEQVEYPHDPLVRFLGPLMLIRKFTDKLVEAIDAEKGKHTVDTSKIRAKNLYKFRKLRKGREEAS